MRTTTKKGIKNAALLILGLVTVVVLTSFNAFKGRKFGNQVPHEELVEYFKNNILPVIKEKREGFDSYLSTEEKQKVAELRERLSALHAERMENFPPRYGQGNFKPGGRPEISDEQREQFRSHMKERRLIMTEAWSIADNHEQEIQAVLEDLEPYFENWRDDLFELMEPYREERQQQREEWRENRSERGNEFRGEGPRGEFGGRPGGRRPGMAGGPMMFAQYATPPMFVLFDAGIILEQLSDIESKSAAVFPNPADGSVKIQFELPQDEKVTIRIYDNQGNLIATPVDEVKDQGIHEEFVDVSGLVRGVYFYEIQSSSLAQKGRIIKR